MNTAQINSQIRVKPRFINNRKEIINFTDRNQHVLFRNRQEAILIESYTEAELTGHLLILPLFSKSRSNKKQGVLMANIDYKSKEEAGLLIREALMCSWELGYHVAFALYQSNLFTENGFNKVPKTQFPAYHFEVPLLYSELSWEGMKQISADLIFPYLLNKQ